MAQRTTLKPGGRTAKLGAGRNRVCSADGDLETIRVAHERTSHRRAAQAISILVALGLSIASAGCQTYNVQTDWDSTVVFDGLQKFNFVEPPAAEGGDPFADNTLLRKRVRLAVESVLVERGYRAVASPELADFLVTYTVVLDEELRVDGISSTGGGFYRRGGGFGSVYTSANVRAYQESTLILDLLEPSSKELVWRGWGTGIVGTRDRDRGDKRMETGIRAILDEFPPEVEAAREAKSD